MPNNNYVTEKAIAKYNVAIDKNISESEAQWNRSSSMLVFNSILITAITLSYQDNLKLPWLITIFLPVAGLITCWLWYSMNSRGFGWINHWIIAAQKIEEKYLKDIDLKLNPILKGDARRKENKSWLNAQRATNILIGMIAISYVIFLCNLLGLNFSNRIINRNRQGVLYLKHKYQDNMVRDRRFP